MTYILVKGKLGSIPDGLMFMVPTNVLPSLRFFSVKTKLRMARECFLGRDPRSADETVASFVERHYGI